MPSREHSDERQHGIQYEQGWSAFGAGTIATNASVVHGGTAFAAALWPHGDVERPQPGSDLEAEQRQELHHDRVDGGTQTGFPTGKVTLAITANGTTNYLTLAQGTVNAAGWTQLTGTTTVSWSGTLTSARFYVGDGRRHRQLLRCFDDTSMQ